MFAILITITITLVVALFLTPIIRKLAVHFKIFATPNHRTIHDASTPKLGGVAIFVAFVVGLSGLSLLTGSAAHIRAFLLGGTVVFIVGFLDDVHQLGCYQKLAGQILAAMIAVGFGIHIDSISLPLGYHLELGLFGPVLSVLWILTLTNALNLLDGLDGLAAGFSILAALFIAIFAIIFGNVAVAAVAALLIAATAGFFRYNFPPAKIFMGDTGSLFLGFTLGCLSLNMLGPDSSGGNVPLLLVLFSIPLADTILAVLRRLSQGIHPFHADKKHIHHRLLEKGFGEIAAVFIVFLMTMVAGLTSLLLSISNLQQGIIWFSGYVMLQFVFLKRLNCFDFFNKKDFLKDEVDSENQALEPKDMPQERYNQKTPREPYNEWSSKNDHFRQDSFPRKKFHSPA